MLPALKIQIKLSGRAIFDTTKAWSSKIARSKYVRSFRHFRGPSMHNLRCSHAVVVLCGCFSRGNIEKLIYFVFLAGHYLKLHCASCLFVVKWTGVMFLPLVLFKLLCVCVCPVNKGLIPHSLLHCCIVFFFVFFFPGWLTRHQTPLPLL